MEARMQLSEMACKIPELFRDTHRKPSARIYTAMLGTHFGTGPAVAKAVSELTHLGYVTTPDAVTIEPMDLGFDEVHRGVA
jgi:hypothetical protein